MRCFRASEDCQHIGINTTISKTGLNADYPVIQNKNLGTASQTLLTEVKLHLWHRLPFFMPGSSFWRCDIHDFHNGGPRAKPGSSGVKTRPERPASRRVSCCLQHKHGHKHWKWRVHRTIQAIQMRFLLRKTIFPALLYLDENLRSWKTQNLNSGWNVAEASFWLDAVKQQTLTKSSSSVIN